MLLFDSNHKIKYWNKKYNLKNKEKQKIQVKPKSKQTNIKFKLDQKLANKTFYNLYQEQLASCYFNYIS